MTSTFKPLYSVKEAAAALGISDSQVRRLAKEFHIEQRYIAAKMLITAASIEEFVAGLPMLPDPDFWSEE